MIKTPLSTVIGGAFWTLEATVIGGSQPDKTPLMWSLVSTDLMWNLADATLMWSQ